jgi:hypothetical protein
MFTTYDTHVNITYYKKEGDDKQYNDETVRICYAHHGLRVERKER